MNNQESIPSRKKDHVDLCVQKNVSFREKSSGFERIEIEYNALPEIDFSEVDCRTVFLGKELQIPLMVSSMTGGYADAENINRQLAEVCQSENIAMGLGSQRQAIISDRFHTTYSVVRSSAPSAIIIANIGAAEIARGIPLEQIRMIIDLVEADAIAIHLNALQELLQPEGTPSFRNVLQGIEAIVQHSGRPVIVKEVGAGISANVAQRLLDAGVFGIDVAGAGGTSWAGVELLRSKQSSLAELWDFGIPTVECLKQVAALKVEQDFQLISSGGVRSGFDVAKSLALTADLAASARPFLTTLVTLGQQALSELIQEWKQQLRAMMFLSGSKNIKELQGVGVVDI